MIILPNKYISRSKFLMPVLKKSWRESSQVISKDQMGNPVVRRHFRLKAKLNDGFVKWIGWFNCREDFDAFLWAIVNKTLPYEKELWDLPNQTWMPFYGYGNVGWRPDIGKNLIYEFASPIYLTATGSQTWNKSTDAPDWNNANNSIEGISGGGSGGAGRNNNTLTVKNSTGGGGGGYAKVVNLNLGSATTVSYTIGAGGTAVTRTTTGLTNGNPGGSTTFNTSSLSITGGGGGQSSTTSAITGGAGGVGSATGGTATYTATGGSGGDSNQTGGTLSNQRIGTGGGGAAGPGATPANNSPGNGNNGVSVADGASAIGTNGGSGDAGNGGSAGTGGSDSNATNGGNGTEWSASYGAGGGGGGVFGGGTARTCGSGGNYGGGGGGNWTNNNTATSGAGIQGLIVITYTPFVVGGNLPMLGL